MAQTATLKLISPDASSVLIPLHSHFATLASSVEQAVTDRFQYKILAYATENDRNTAYTESTGLAADTTSSKPALTDGDICYIRQNKRYFIWNLNSGTGAWTETVKRFVFSSIANRDLMPSDDIATGDTCYVTDSALDFVWDGSLWSYTGTSASPKVSNTTWYQPAVFGTSTGTPLVNRIYYIPFHVPVKGTYDAYNLMVVTGVASTSMTFGLFNSSTTTGLPTSLISGSQATSPTATSTQSIIQTMTTAQSLTPGWYWIAAFEIGATMPTVVTTRLDASGGGHWWMPRSTGSYSATNASNPEVFDSSNTGTVAGTMPSPAGTISTTTASGTRAPFISLRRSTS